MHPSKRTRMSIRKQNRVPRYTEEEDSDFVAEEDDSDFVVDQVRQSVEDGKDDDVKRSVEASTIEGVDLQHEITMPPIGNLQLNRNPAELEDSECTDSQTDTVVRKNTSERPVPSADHPPLQPAISAFEKGKGVWTPSPKTPNTSGRHVASASWDHGSSASKRPRRSVKKKVYKGAMMTRDRAYEAEMEWAPAESRKEYDREMQRSIHGSPSRGIPLEGTSSHAAALEDDVAEPAKGDSDDEIDPAAVEWRRYSCNDKGPKENPKDKKDDNDDSFGGPNSSRMRSLCMAAQWVLG